MYLKSVKLLSQLIYPFKRYTPSRHIFQVKAPWCTRTSGCCAGCSVATPASTPTRASAWLLRRSRCCWCGLVWFGLLLVGGLVAIFYFPRNIGNFIIPIDVHIFQRSGPTTNQIIILIYIGWWGGTFGWFFHSYWEFHHPNWLIITWVNFLCKRLWIPLCKWHFLGGWTSIYHHLPLIIMV